MHQYKYCKLSSNILSYDYFCLIIKESTIERPNGLFTEQRERALQNDSCAFTTKVICYAGPSIQFISSTHPSEQSVIIVCPFPSPSGVYFSTLSLLRCQSCAPSGPSRYIKLTTRCGLSPATSSPVSRSSWGSG